MSSFQTQYGLRLSRELQQMKWDEFKDMLSGLGPDTPLGRMVSIRSEDDPEILELFSPEQKRIRMEWRTRAAKDMSQEDMDNFLETMKQALIQAAGGR
ncbi:MAG: Gp15 family bacteriophage protein [Blautia sp.]|uniref:Gp15 family bacteriophage protein n=1 Tax=Blautia TaxID=572511 RepID=UPI001FA9AA2F|nr:MULTISPECIES: Gp15 family bacteriophage protein [Blautia]MDR3891717.1 Gp15 family bacteriophage protein [Blautia sp.]